MSTWLYNITRFGARTLPAPGRRWHHAIRRIIITVLFGGILHGVGCIIKPTHTGERIETDSGHGRSLKTRDGNPTASF